MWLIGAFLVGTMVANGIGISCMKTINKKMDTLIELNKAQVYQNHNEKVRNEVISYMVKEAKRKSAPDEKLKG